MLYANNEFKKSVEGKRVITITDSDSDGSQCRLLFEFFLPHFNCKSNRFFQTKVNEIEYIKDQLSRYDTILFADLAPTKELYDWCISENKDVWIFDHHKTTREILGELPQYIYDVNRSATQIVFDFMQLQKVVDIPESLRIMVSYVNAYDLWLANTEEWKKGKWLNAILWSYIKPHRWSNNEARGYKNYIDFQLRKIEKHPDKFIFFPSERVVIAEDAELERKATKKAFETKKLRKDSQGRKYIYFESGAKISLLAHRFLSSMQTIDYVVAHNTFDKKLKKFSLRSRENEIDVSVIAQVYGGGGHQAAAGIELEDDQLFEDIKIGRKHFV